MVHLPPDRGGGGGVRRVLRRLPLPPLRADGGAAGGWPADRRGGNRPDRGEGGRPGAAIGGRRPAEVQPGGQALRRVPAGNDPERASRPGRGQVRSLAAAGQESGRWRRTGGERCPQEGESTVPAPQLVRQAPPSEGWNQPAVQAGGDQTQEALEPLPGGGGAGTAGGCPAAHNGIGRRPRRRGPGLAAGGNLLCAAGPGAGTAHLHRAAGRLRRHRRRDPAGSPRPGPEGAGLRRQGRQDPEDGRELHLPDRGGQKLQPDAERPVAVLHLLLGGCPRIKYGAGSGKVRRGFAEERPDPLPPAVSRRRAVRPGADLPGVDPRINHRRYRLGVHRRDQAGGVVAGIRRPLQPDGARPAGRHRHPHRGKGQRRRGVLPGQRVLCCGRPDPLHPSRGEPQGDPRGGNHC